MTAAPATLPATVLSGLLGAGKTTLLNHALASRDGLRVAIIVNDMSEINIDAAPVRDGGGLPRTEERLVEMTHGCMLFRAPEPFHPQRLWDFLATAVDRYGVLRSKGFLWLASRPDTVALWSQCDPVGIPVAVSGEWPDDPAELERLREPVFGDRRQELVFIGVDLPAADLRAGLERCLLTPEELAAGEEAWRLLPDPFPAWPADELVHQH